MFCWIICPCPPSPCGQLDPQHVFPKRYWCGKKSGWRRTSRLWATTLWWHRALALHRALHEALGKGLTVRTQQPCITSRTTRCLPIAVLVRASQHHWHHLGQWQDQAKKWSQSIESATSFQMLLGTKNCTASIGKSRSSAKLLRQHISLTKAFHWSSISFWPEG